jgi:hypothetical protein
MTAST